MVDVLLLSRKISESGLKKDYLAEQCGLSRQGFYNKLNGITDFTSREIKILCNCLNITKLTEKERIFFAESVPKNGNEVE